MLSKQSLLSELTAQEIEVLIENPPAGMGDFAFPCFRLAKSLKMAPPIIAKQLADELSSQNVDFLAEIKNAGPYVNFNLNRDIFCMETLADISSNPETFGQSGLGKGKNIVIDYSSPNIAKSFHAGHLRSTVIGGSLYKIFSFLGYNVVGINHLGDWGTQFGKLIVAYRRWSSPENVKKDGLLELDRIYAKFNEAAKEEPGLADEARAWFVKMQNGDTEALEIWQWFKDISMDAAMRLYELLDVSFDHFIGESFFNDKMDAVVKDLADKGLLIEDDGARIVDLSAYNMPPCLILRRDGGTLYPTRDISCAIYRQDTFKFDKCLYVTDVGQSLHFNQWFKVVELMGYEWADKLIHVPFGLYLSEDGKKFSTRAGTGVLMEEMLDEAIRRALDIIKEKNPNLEGKEQVAQAVGVGAIIFNDLYNGRIKDNVFSWDKVLNFEGETGPYVQYAHARAVSVLDKAAEMGFEYKNASLSGCSDDATFDLVMSLAQFPEKVEEAALKLEPYMVARQLVLIAQGFNRFYHECPILTSQSPERELRLMITACTRNILATGLKLLGVSAPLKM